MRRALVCILAVVGTACCIGLLESSENQEGSGLLSMVMGSERGGGGGGRSELLAKGQGFQKWYQEQTADRWFGSDMFQGKDVSGVEKRQKGKWVGKTALTMIPKAEREHADRKLKGRLVQLAMTNMMAKQKYHSLEQQLVQKDFNYRPTLSAGTLSEPEVHAVVHRLLVSWLNRTASGINATADSGVLQHETAEEKERKRAEQKAKEEAEKELDRTLAAASPKLKNEYEEEVQQHEAQNRK